jgi:hypothetical protein
LSFDFFEKTRMYRQSDWLELIFLLLAFVLMVAGAQLSLPVLTNLGGVSIGAFALVGGIQAIRTRRLGFETRQRNFGPRSIYTGLAAQLWGVLFIAFAILVFILAGVALFYPGGPGAFWAVILGKSWGWGIILTGIGLTAMVSGIIILMAGSAGYYKGLADLVEHLSGFLPLFIGLGVTAIGFLLLIVPGWLMSITHLVITSLERRIFHLYYATYNNGAWNAAQAVDLVSVATDSQPALAYLNAVPRRHLGAGCGPQARLPGSELLVHRAYPNRPSGWDC